MKSTIFFGAVLAIALFTSCEKDNPDPVTPDNVSIRYEFMADQAADYRFSYKQDTAYYEEIAVTTTWTKSVAAPRNGTSPTAQLILYPPASWQGTTEESNVQLKLFLDNVQVKDTSYLLSDLDRTDGISVTASY
jgi:hypothetical protein